MVAGLALILSTIMQSPGDGSLAAAGAPATPVGEVVVTAPPRAAPAATLYKRLSSEPDVVICKRRQVAGSLLAAPPVCMTNLDWAELTARDQQWLRLVQSRGELR